MLSAGRTYCACARRGTATRAQGGYSAAYAYRYGDRLRQVTSNFPGEGNSPVYEYGGDGKLRMRGAEILKYGLGFNPVNERTWSLAAKSFVYEPHKAVGERLAYFGMGFDTSNHYHYHDHLGSVRRTRHSGRQSFAAYEYEPYGKRYPSGAPFIFALHPYESGMAFYHAPYRNYSANMARWTTRDPLGMVDGPNMYGYVRGNPVDHYDPLGKSLVITIGGGALIWGGIAIVSTIGLIWTVNQGDLYPNQKWNPIDSIPRKRKCRDPRVPPIPPIEPPRPPTSCLDLAHDCAKGNGAACVALAVLFATGNCW